MNDRPLNVIRPVRMRGGWIGLFTGVSQVSAMEPVVTELNAEGYRLVWTLTDEWSLARKLLNLVIFTVTLGIVGFKENILIVGERV